MIDLEKARKRLIRILKHEILMRRITTVFPAAVLTQERLNKALEYWAPLLKEFA